MQSYIAYFYTFSTMKKWITFFTTVIITLTACAQEHSNNLSRLKKINEVVDNTVLLNNHSNIIPFNNLNQKSIASVNLGYAYQTGFDSLLNKYDKIALYSAQVYKDSATLNDLEDDLKFFNTILIAVNPAITSQAKYFNFINNLAKDKAVIIAFFGDGKSLSFFDNTNAPIVFTNQTNPEAALVLPQIIFGGIVANKTLKTGFSPKFTVGSGFITSVTRLKYTVPEDADVNSEDLTAIDKITAEAIANKAAPGMVVLVAKDGKVIFNKAYGTHTYDGTQANKITDIFDLASITKVTATTPIVMRLVEEKKLNLDTNIGFYIAKARNTPMNNINVREVMLHQAGFIPYIPFHNYIKDGDFSRDSTAAYPTKVADNFYIKKGFFNNFMWPKMLNSPRKTRGKYVYSDISMYVMQDIVEHLTTKPENQYVWDNFYKPLGMQTAGFLPRNRFSKAQIVPTEDDQVFRKTLLNGFVHDQGAALAGGVAGHAGLFASANDVAIFYQMLLNNGTYGGQQYFKPQTVATFTAKQSEISRRGLGFDRSDPDSTKKYPSALASAQTFGHTGYTGTCVWVDKERGLVYIFLSNRVNPTVSEVLGKLNIRPRIHDAINAAIDKGKKR